MKHFRPATISEYVSWLTGYINAGRKPTHYYDYPWSRSDFLVVLRDFRLGGECGSLSRPIIVPEGIKHTGGGLGHNTLYYMDSFRLTGRWVPVYNDVIFTKIPGNAINELKSRELARDDEATKILAEMEAERKKASQDSDLSHYIRTIR